MLRVVQGEHGGVIRVGHVRMLNRCRALVFRCPQGAHAGCGYVKLTPGTAPATASSACAGRPRRATGLAAPGGAVTGGRESAAFVRDDGGRELAVPG